MRNAIDLWMSIRVVLGVSALAIPVNSYAAQSSYFTGPSKLPGAIYAEHFDTGGEGVAYHDSTPENEPGAYRTEGVDIESSEEGGYDIGWITPGEWLEYTVDVTSAGTYTTEIRYAADGYGGTMHIEFGGIDKTGPIELSDSGGWQTWQTITKRVELDAGTQVMRLAFDTGSADGWLANIDRIQVFEQAPYAGRSSGRRIESEHYDEGGEGIAYHDTTPENEPGAFRTDEGVDVEETSDEGGGYDVGWILPGEWLEYRIGYQSEPYTFAVRYASQGFGGTMHIEVGGVDKTGPIELLDTGGWQVWNTIYVRGVNLPGETLGDHRIMRLSFDTPGPDGWLANINWVELIQGPDAASGPPVTIPYAIIEAERYDFGGEMVAYHDSTPENEGGADLSVNRGYAVDVETTSDVGGGYDVGWITPGEWLIYSTYVSETATYTPEIRFAADGHGGFMHLEFFYPKRETIRTGPIELPGTGGWQTWQTLTVPNIHLPQGRWYMRMVFDTGNADGWLANINWVRFTKAGP